MALKLSPEDCSEMMRMFTLVTNYEDTLATIDDHQPKVIVAASGMVTRRKSTFLSGNIYRKKRKQPSSW